MPPIEPITGFLLSRQQYDKHGQCHFEFWCKTQDGVKQLIVNGERPVCFVRQSDLEQLQLLLHKKQQYKLKIEFQPVDLTDFESNICVGCYCETLQDYYRFRSFARQVNIELLEDDIKPVDRFLMERFIQGDMAFIGQYLPSQPSNYSRFEHVRIKKSAPLQLSLTSISVDIECDEHGNLYSIGLYSKDFNRQCEIVLYNLQGVDKNAKRSANSISVEWLTNETEVLQRFVQLVQEFDPDCLVGWNFVQFDIRLLDKASKRLGVPLLLGRDNSKLEFHDGKRAGKSGNEQRFPDKAYVAGRVVLDGIEVMRNATYHFNSFSLNNVASELLGETKLIQASSGLDKLAEIKRQYQFEPEKLAEYNLQDCKLVFDIFQQERLLEFLITRTRLTGLELDKVGGSVAAFTNLYLPQIHRKGWIAPNLVAPEDYLHSPGGFVMDSQPGLHDDVLVFDFKSLYPSIMRTFNVDPVALIESKGLVPEQTIPGFRGGQFSRGKSILSDILDKLWQAREQAKKDKNKVWSNAIKIIMNSFYGVLGSAGCRFYDTKLASSITMRGHWVLQESKYWFENKGLNVIYGDTDSIFVCLDDTPFSASDGKQLEKELNLWWRQRLLEEFNLISKLEMEFETHYSPFFMPTVRGSDAGSKKRYAGLVKTDQGEQLIFKGLETVRSDWTELAKSFQKSLLQLVFTKQPCRSFIQQTIDDLRSGKLDDKLVYQKRIRQPLDSYVKTTPPHVKAARKANLASRSDVYFRGTNVYYVVTTKGPEVKELLASAIDYEHYVDKQLLPIAESLLEFHSPEVLSEFNLQYTIFL